MCYFSIVTFSLNFTLTCIISSVFLRIAFKTPELVQVKRYKATAVRLYNNNLTSIVGLAAVLDEILVDGSKEVTWLDLSFNGIKRIEDVCFTM